jgi:transposase InsO family protein
MATSCPSKEYTDARQADAPPLSKFILFGEDHLRRAIREFVEHFDEDRPHQGLGNRPIRDREETQPIGDGEVP